MALSASSVGQKLRYKGASKCQNISFRDPIRAKVWRACSKRAGRNAARRRSNQSKDWVGRLEAFYYAFGNDDFVVIADLPSNVDASALSLTANATAAVKSRMTVLITPEEIDQATKRTVKFRPPGK